MRSARAVVAAIAIALALTGVTSRSFAQQTAADTAAVLLSTAQRAAAEGQRDLAAQLLRFIINRYAETPVAHDARSRLSALYQWEESGSGTVALTAWGTVYASWLGVAVPAALGAEDTEPFGAGLLVGAPLGFFGSRAYGRSHGVTAGEAEAIILGSEWGTVQGLGWREVLDIGDETLTVCSPFSGCFQYQEDSDTAPFAAAVIGGVVGLGAGWALAVTRDIAAGDASLANHAWLWGGLFGLGSGVLASDDDDVVLAWSLVGSNIGLLAGIAGTRAWSGSSGRIRLISAAGVAGAALGFGVDLLFNIDENEAVIAPMLMSGLGLVAGAALTRTHDLMTASHDRDEEALALVRLGRRPAIGFPTPLPTVLPVVDAHGRVHPTPGVTLRLIEARF